MLTWAKIPNCGVGGLRIKIDKEGIQGILAAPRVGNKQLCLVFSPCPNVCESAQKMKFNDDSVGSAENHWRLQYFWLI